MTYHSKFVALADPTRRAIFERLRRGAMPVGKLAEGFDVTRPAVSQHLRVLQEAGLVQSQRVGASNFYSVDVGGLEELRRYLDQFWGDVLDAFASEANRAIPAKRKSTFKKTRRAAKHGKR